eukprot:1838064-Rhodomonas_salina.2
MAKHDIGRVGRYPESAYAVLGASPRAYTASATSSASRSAPIYGDCAPIDVGCGAAISGSRTAIYGGLAAVYGAALTFRGH